MPFTSIADFEATESPTTAERALIAAVRAGSSCVLNDGIRPTTPGDATKIRADLLRLLILGGTPDCGLHDSGVWLEGGYITGTLDLRYAKARGQSVLLTCHFSDMLRLTQARLPQLSLDGCLLPGLFAQGLKITGSLYLRKLVSTRTVNLNASQIGGQLNCSGSTIDGAGGQALNAQGVITGDSLFLNNLTATGTVDLNAAQIGGQLACVDALLDGAGAQALNAQGVTTKSGLFLNRLTANGTVDANAAQIGGQFACDGMILDGMHGYALNAQSLQVSDALLWGGIIKCKGGVNLNAAHVATLVDDAASWAKVERLNLDGFSYDRITASATDAKTRLKWLRKGSVIYGQFHPQPYTQLAKVL